MGGEGDSSSRSGGMGRDFMVGSLVSAKWSGLVMMLAIAEDGVYAVVPTVGMDMEVIAGVACCVCTFFARWSGVSSTVCDSGGLMVRGSFSVFFFFGGGAYWFVFFYFSLIQCLAHWGLCYGCWLRRQGLWGTGWRPLRRGGVRFRWCIVAFERHVG